jgi:Ketopantoate reductase
MKILVYGAGVIGSYLAHVLCTAGHDVSLLARGKRKEELQQKGLEIHHYLQHKITVDHPQIVGRLKPEEHYDAVFAVMQYQQMWAILNDLAACDSPLVMLVGNNPSAAQMERYLQHHSPAPKTVLFGFQATGGRRENGAVICVRPGAGGLECGALHSEPDETDKARLAKIFAGTKYQPSYFSDMDAWYQCHLAMVLPVGYVCYANGCDLKKASAAQRRQMVTAVREGYGLLQALGYPVLPEGCEKYLEKGLRRCFLSVLLWIMAKTGIGRLAASDHCRSALTEMQALDKAFRAMRTRKPDFPMPVWSELERYMPSKNQ